jgi:gamma-glutamylcyclotransferase (GGCT)/AIG2-like uncharacterized protein YtfP
MAASELLFVYGSLKRGGRHHDELRGARFLGSARTEPGYALGSGSGDYLAMASRPETDSVVQGEVFEIDSALVPALDAFEGEEYYREYVRVTLAGGGPAAPIEVLAYLGKAR